MAVRPLGIVHHQFDVFEEVVERAELAHRAHEFLEVVEPRLRLWRFVRLKHVGIARLLENDFQQPWMFCVRRLRAPALHVEQEAAQARPGRPLDVLAAYLHVCNAREVGVHLPRCDVELLDRGVANAALGLVDHALEGEVVSFRADQAQIGEGVADLRALEEARSADDAIGRSGDDEAFLERPHLPRRAHQDGAFVIAPAILAPAGDVVADQPRFLLAIPDAAHLHEIARVRIRPQRLAETAGIVGDHRARRSEDMRGRPIILLQPHNLRAGKILLEAQDVVDLRSAPAIDRLVVIPHAANIIVPLRQQPQPQILRHVGVLILVHQDVAEPVVVVGEHFLVLGEDADRVQQQVAEIDRVQRRQPVLVELVQLLAFAFRKLPRLARRQFLRPDRTVLPAVDQAGEIARRPPLLVDAFRFEDLLDQPQLVIRIQHSEARLQLRQLRMPPQDLRGDGVECTKPPQPLALVPDQFERALAHLPRGLVREGDHEHLARPCLPLRQDMRHPRRQHARLAGPRAREHEQWPLRRHHSIALFGVQTLQVVGIRTGVSLRPGRRRPLRDRARILVFRRRLEPLLWKRNVLVFRQPEELRRTFGQGGVVVRPRLPVMGRLAGRRVVREGDVRWIA